MSKAQGGVLAEPQTKKGRLGQLFADQAFRQVAGQSVQQIERRLVHRRQPEQEPVVAVQTRRRQPEPLADSSQQGQLERMVQPAAERREHGQPELARRVDERLDHDGAIIGHGPRQPLLTQDILSQATRQPWA